MNIEKVVYRHYRISEVDLPNVDWLVEDFSRKVPIVDYLHAYS